MSKRIFTAALCGLAITFATGTAKAQTPPPATGTMTMTPPTQGYAVARPRGVLQRFSSRGGIGTTPYLGNTRGLGAYSTNYDRPIRPRRALMFRRWRR